MSRITENPDAFIANIPRNVPENIQFRMDLHNLLTKDEGLQRVFLQLCKERPQIFFDAMAWTFDPRNQQGHRNLPFILREAQIDIVNGIKDAIDNQFDMIIDKSRDEGATELICKMYVLSWLLDPESQFLVGSRKAEFVDKGVEVKEGRISGDHKCLFHKILYGIVNLPNWIRPPLYKTYMHVENELNGAVIDGESTNENFGAGDRRTSVLVDEHGRCDYRIAQALTENLSDVTKCVIYNSTHFYGISHPYNKLLTSGKIKVMVLPWDKNPVKNYGLYRSPDLNIIEIKDINYYRKKYPKCFDNIESMIPFRLSELEVDLISKGLQPDISFIADGGLKNEGGWRSPWYDKEEERRLTRRDMAQNVDRSPMGSGDMFFDAGTLRKIRTETMKPANYVGEVLYKFNKNGKIDNPKFRENAGKKRLKWWGKLINGRPEQKHNYIVACDISGGTGASNSVAQIYDVNTREQVGEWTCPNTPPESFAEQTIAICKWVGGAAKKAYLIWEANGPGGSFENRIIWHGYNFVYTRKDERGKIRKQKNSRGWWSGRTQKFDLLLELDIAMAEGLRTNPKHRAIIVRSEDSLKELEGYITAENNSIIPGQCIDDSAGARAAHGDRIIPLALIILALTEQPKAALKQIKAVVKNSMAYRTEQRKFQARQDKMNRRFIY